MRWQGCLVLLIPVVGCATTADTVHRWAKDRDFGRIRQELRKGPSEEVRAAAALELGHANCSVAIPDLVALSRDPSPEVRGPATASLGNCAGSEVYNALIERTGDDSQDVARTAETVLRTWGHETLQYLLDALTNRNYRVRAAAVKVLGTMNDEAVGPALQDVAGRDENSLVRRQAVTALGLRNYLPAKKLLHALRNTDPSREVALEAERALAKLGGTVSDSRLLVLPLRPAEASLARLGKDAAAALTGRLVQGRLCEVLPGTEAVAAAPDPRQAAVQEATRVGADQVVYGTVERDRNRVILTVYRLQAAGGKLLQQESAAGYESAAEKLVDELARTFGSRYQ